MGAFCIQHGSAEGSLGQLSAETMEGKKVNNAKINNNNINFWKNKFLIIIKDNYN